MAASYFIPNLPGSTLHRCEETIKRSRFIASLAHAPDPISARAFIDRLRAEFPDATHNCWAFAAGAPGDSGRVGCSDDGEPHGTAGRPMLNQLLHGGVGEVCVVVTRYFGGVKLGTGGLVRAYRGMTAQALETVPLREHMMPARLEVILDYRHVSPFLRLLSAHGAVVEADSFGADAVYQISLPCDAVRTFTTALLDLTDGTVLIREVAEEESGPTTQSSLSAPPSRPDECPSQAPDR